MYGIFHIRSVSVGLDSQIWYLFIYITGYLNVRKISETMDFRTFVGPLVVGKSLSQIVDKFPCMKASLFQVSLILLTFWIRGDLI